MQFSLKYIYIVISSSLPFILKTLATPSFPLTRSLLPLHCVFTASGETHGRATAAPVPLTISIIIKPFLSSSFRSLPPFPTVFIFPHFVSAVLLVFQRVFPASSSAYRGGRGKVLAFLVLLELCFLFIVHFSYFSLLS